MGCGFSRRTQLKRLGPGGEAEEQDEAADKSGGRGDSAGSKGTSDSGVAMENRELPGEVPFRLSPLNSECVGERKATQRALKQAGGPARERLKSSEILEELLNEGIIPGETGKAGGSGEVFSVMLNDSEEVRRRPPARLESLGAKNTPSVLTREEIERKMRQAEERRKSREDELKTRLRSARVRQHAPITDAAEAEEDEDAFLTPVEQLPSAFATDDRKSQ